MTQKQQKLKSIVQSAIDEFNEKEKYLYEHDLSERCICSKFAFYLEREIVNSEFEEYIVDVEYNRGMHGNEYAKKVLDEHDAVLDLIVHKRGYDDWNGFDNLICMEMKKGGGVCRLASDKKRLKKLTDPNYGFKYRIGFMLVVRKKGIAIDETFCNPVDY